MRACATLAICFALAACHRGPAPVAFDGALTTDNATMIRHGERLTWILGCRGCHGDDLGGRLWDDDPKEYGVTWAPNLTRSVQVMSDLQLSDVIKRGKHPRRSRLWSMPSEMFQHLADVDFDALIAYLRSLPPEGDPSPDPVLGPKARAQIADGTIKPADVLVRELKNVLPADLGPRHALGRYIATVACTECHGHQLEGHADEDGSTPNLVIAAAYSPDEFRALTTKGVASGGRKISPLMRSVGKNRLSRLTQHERDALYAYLKARAEQP